MRVLFVTGKLAERALRQTLGALPAGIQPEVAVLGITVAALMTPRWIVRAKPKTVHSQSMAAAASR